MAQIVWWQRLFDLAEAHGQPLMLACERELRAAFDEAPAKLQRAAMISCDHSLVSAEYGLTSPQAILVRELYAAAMA